MPARRAVVHLHRRDHAPVVAALEQIHHLLRAPDRLLLHTCDCDTLLAIEHLQVGAAAQQVVEAVVVDLDVRAAHEAGLLLPVCRTALLCQLVEEVNARSRHDAALRRVALDKVGKHGLRAEHGVRLAAASLAVREDRRVAPAEHVDDAIRARGAVDAFLALRFLENRLKQKLEILDRDHLAGGRRAVLARRLPAHLDFASRLAPAHRFEPRTHDD